MRDPKLYEKANIMPQRDVTEILAQNPIKWKQSNARIIDVGCGEGSLTTNILMKYIPENFEKLVGCDVNQSYVDFAQEHFGRKEVQFFKLDIGGDLPDELKGQFDHVFSSYAFHWVNKQQTAFSNVYDMLAEDGNCLVIFLGYTRIHEVYQELSQTPKWSTDLREIRSKFMSPYHYSKDTENEIRSIMERVGFKDINVKVIPKEYVYEGGLEEFKSLMKLLNPFDSLKAKWDDFMSDYIDIEPNADICKYRLIIAFGTK